MRKVAIVSHILPPSPSGQAMMLHRLLKEQDPSTYCLISKRHYAPEHDLEDKTDRLPAPYFHLARDLTERALFGWRPIFEFFTVPTALVLRATRILKILKSEASDVVIACTGDLLDLPAGFLASRLARVPFIAYLFDDYVYQWADPKIRRVASWFANRMIRKSEGVIVTNEFLGDEYRERYDVECAIIRNPGFEQVGEGEPDLKSRERVDVSIVYTGAIYHAHFDAFHRLLEAISLLERQNVRLHLYTTQSRGELSRHGIVGPLVLHDHLPVSEVASVQRQADILFLPLAFDSPIPEVIRTSSPGKMGEYFAAGRPVLVHAPSDTFLAYYCRQHECGLVVDQPESVRLSEAITKLMDNPSLRARLISKARWQAETEFSPQESYARFKELVQRVESVS